MSIYRIWGVILRHLYLFKTNITRITDVFYWPAIDILLWGVTFSFLESAGSIPNLTQTILSGLVLWTIIYRGQNEISVGLMEEVWNRNLINLYVSPLKFGEWITAVIIMSSIKNSVTFIFSLLLCVFIYGVQILELGVIIIPYIALLLIISWSFGLLVSGLIYLWGSRVEIFAWSIVAIFSPLSAVYYPVSALPQTIQIVSKLLPTTYIFEGMRYTISTGTYDWNGLTIAAVLTLVLFTIAVVFVNFCFSRVLNNGLVKFK